MKSTTNRLAAMLLLACFLAAGAGRLEARSQSARIKVIQASLKQARALTEQGRLSEARKLAEEALALHESGRLQAPELGVLARYYLADIHAAQRRHQRAVALYEEALALRAKLSRSARRRKKSVAPPA